MTAGDDQADEVLRKLTFCELVNRQVTDHVIHAVQGFAQRRRQGLGRADTDSQRTDESRAGRDRDRVNVSEGHPGLVHSSVERG